MADDQHAESLIKAPGRVTTHPRRRRPDLAGSTGRRAGPELACVPRPVQAIVHVRLAPAASRQGFEQCLRAMPAVLSAWQVTGDVDYELRLACRDIADLDAVLTALRRCGGAEGTSTGLVLREVPGLGEAEPSGLSGTSGPAAGSEWRIR